MKIFLTSLSITSLLILALALGCLYLDNLKLKTENTDLLWRNVTVEERRDVGKQRPVDQLAALKASQLTGCPLEVILRARSKGEHGGMGYEMGYRGKSQGVIENYEPSEWQYGEWPRRMNGIIWQELLSTPEGGALLERASKVYTGADKKRAKEYANYLRGK